MLWHAYKYLVKTVHRVFFAVFSLLENPDSKSGDRVVAQRKLLFLEKLFASLLLGAPKVKEQLKNRIKELQGQDAESSQSRCTLLKVLVAMDDLLFFFLPAVFRVGYKVRCCTWQGREAGSGIWAREILEQVQVLLVHLLKDVDGKNEYVRTLSVALAAWHPWMSKIPAVCFVEESCEALLSRMGHRCDVYRNLHGFENTFDLFLTLPPPKRGLKATRGMLKAGLVQVFAARIRKVLFGDGNFFFAPIVGAREMHSVLVDKFPADIEFPVKLDQPLSLQLLEHVLRRGIRCLTSKTKMQSKVEQFMNDNVANSTSDMQLEYGRSIEDLNTWFRTSRPRVVRTPKPPPKKRLMPKPRGLPLHCSAY